MPIEGAVPAEWVVLESGRLGVVCRRPTGGVSYLGRASDDEVTRVDWSTDECLDEAQVWSSVRDMTGAIHAWEGLGKQLYSVILERQMVPASVMTAGPKAVAGYLYAVGGMDVDEIAGTLEIAPATVRTYLRRHRNGWYRDQESYM